MKILKLLSIALIGTGLLASCSDDDLSKGTNKGEGDVWVSFALTLPSMSNTRAAGDLVTDLPPATAGELYAGNVNEQKIESARIVLYNNADVAQYVFDLNVTKDGASGSIISGADIVSGNTSTTNGTTVAKLVEKQPYKALVILNPTAAILTNTNEGMSVSDLDAPAVQTATAMLTTGGAVLMTNEQGLVNVTVDNLKTTSTEAEGAPVAVKVDRVLAKVFVTKNETLTTAEGDVVEDLQWTTDITNRKTFWLRKMGLLASGTQEAFGDASSRFDRYAEDPNFTSYVGNDDPIPAEFNYKTQAEIVSSLQDLGFEDAVGSDQGIYVLENTMAADNQYEVVTTRVILKAVYTPKYPEGVTAGADKSWASYKNYKLPLNVFQDKIAAAKAFTGNADEADGTIGMPYGFVAEVKDKTFDFANSFVDGNVKFYKDGVSFYRILIRHFNNDQQPEVMGYGRFGVVRNNIYKLTINSIKAPGEPVAPEPEGPNEKEEAWISFDIEILPWVIRTQGVDL